jgi:hypothetical protein
MMRDIKPLLRVGFPEHWGEICALAMVRVPSNVPLKRAKDAWEKLYNAEDIRPSLNQKNLTNMLREVGVNRAGQNVVFKKLADMSNQLVYDLSSMFSRSMSINQAERGYNKDKIQVPQINLALLCSADTGLPTMIRSLPGKAIFSMLTALISRHFDDCLPFSMFTIADYLKFQSTEFKMFAH